MTDQPHKPEPLCNDPRPHEHDITPQAPGDVGLVAIEERLDQLTQAVGRLGAKVDAENKVKCWTVGCPEDSSAYCNEHNPMIERLVRERDDNQSRLNRLANQLENEPGGHLHEKVPRLKADRDAQMRRADEAADRLGTVITARDILYEQVADLRAQLADAEAKLKTSEAFAKEADHWHDEAVAAQERADSAQQAERAQAERVRELGGELNECRRARSEVDKTWQLTNAALGEELARNARLVAAAGNAIAKVGTYLSLGGLFNPEMMEHEKVRDMVVEIRDELRAALAGQPKGEGAPDCSRDEMLAALMHTPPAAPKSEACGCCQDDYCHASGRECCGKLPAAPKCATCDDTGCKHFRERGETPDGSIPCAEGCCPDCAGVGP